MYAESQGKRAFVTTGQDGDHLHQDRRGPRDQREKWLPLAGHKMLGRTTEEQRREVARGWRLQDDLGAPKRVKARVSSSSLRS
jgi:hypothetical protein